MPVKGTIIVDENLCKACELCIDACPQEVIALNQEVITPRGYHPAHLVQGRLHRLRHLRHHLSGSGHHRLP